MKSLTPGNVIIAWMLPCNMSALISDKLQGRVHAQNFGMVEQREQAGKQTAAEDNDEEHA